MTCRADLGGPLGDRGQRGGLYAPEDLGVDVRRIGVERRGIRAIANACGNRSPPAAGVPLEVKLQLFALAGRAEGITDSGISCGITHGDAGELRVCVSRNPITPSEFVQGISLVRPVNGFSAPSRSGIAEGLLQVIRMRALFTVPILVFIACGNPRVGANPDATPDASADVTTDGVSDTAADLEADSAEADSDTGDEPPPLVTRQEALDHVNPFVGSGGIGFGYASGTPAAQRPLGLIKVGPDTTNHGSHLPQAHFSGYNDMDPHIRGFSHVRLVGTGAADLGNLRVLPVTAVPDEPWNPWTTLDKHSERATPGWYACRLPDEGVDAVMSAGRFAAAHRYEYEGQAILLVDPAASIIDSGVVEARIDWTGEVLTGVVSFRGPFTGRARGFELFFDIAVTPTPIAVSGWNDEGIAEGAEMSGTRAGLILEFEPGSTVELEVGVSLIDSAAARANREAELVDVADVETLAELAAAEWTETIDNVLVAGGTERERTIFYSALYNAYRMPTVLSEPDGRYRGFDLDIHDAEGHRYVSDLSMWDTYRTLHPWYSLTDPDAQRDSVLSLLLMSDQGGDGVPRWPAMLGETGSMIGESADIVIGDAAAHGLDGVDWSRAFDALYANSYGRLEGDGALGREGVEDYAELGYLPADRFDESVSKTLEYAWNDFGLAAVARAAGEEDQAEALSARALSFTNLIHPDEAFPWPRDADGSFQSGFSPRDVYMREGPITEGNAWHWRFYGLHAPEALAEAMGGPGAVAAALDEFFERSSLTGDERPNNFLPDPFYWHGNEPAIHAAALYSALGDIDRATHWTRQIQEWLYDDTPAGLPGNDDGGTLSSWYLFAAIGLYPVAGSDLYYLTVPLFERIELDMGRGDTLTILASGATWERRSVEEIRLDGQLLDRTSVRYEELAGATLEFVLREDAQ